MKAAAEVELEFYERFFLSRDLEPYPVQEEAFERIFREESLLVTVPTGTGKTLIAKAGLMLALETGRTAIYTTPLRALTEEKYRELCDDFGADKVGFATGDYKVNPDAPIQVLVAEILWNRIYSDQDVHPADIVVMDEGHYFNDYERGYVWEESIIGLHPRSQLVILSATVGQPEAFCQWVHVTRKQPMALVRSDVRRVPLHHEYREQYLVEVVKELYASQDYPAIIFSFGRRLCFERARLLKACPRFVSKEEQAEIQKRSDAVLLPSGIGPELQKLLLHGVGVHHAGILPAYRRLVEELTADRLLKFVVTTETIAAGINLPAKRVVFPSLRKYISGEARLLLPAEYHQMSGRAGRPQFDKEGISLVLAPEEVVQEFRKEIRELKKRGGMLDEARVKKKYYALAQSAAKAKGDVTWDEPAFTKIVEGEPAELKSRTRITAEQILAIGLPNLECELLPGEEIIRQEAEEARKKAEAAGLEPPPLSVEARKIEAKVEAMTRRLNIRDVIDKLLLPEHEKFEAHRQLAQITANLQALGVLDAKGAQIDGKMIGHIRGMDGVFVWYALTNHGFDEAGAAEFIEFLVDHDVIHKIFERKARAALRQIILERLREGRQENPQLTFEDAEAAYLEAHPPELSQTQLIHQAFVQKLPHPELHGGKTQKKVYQEMAEADLSFIEYVEKHDLGQEEGSLFTYLARVMKAARMLSEASGISHFAVIEKKVQTKLAAIDERVLGGLW